MSGRYSAVALLREGLAGHRGWPQAWRKAKPKPAYDFVIIGGGNTGRNTTIVRSNYLYPESVALYDLALRLHEGLSRELNFNVMLSQRGILNLAHTQAPARDGRAAHQRGVDAELRGP
jgi:sarcosine oxidase subunit beta